MAKDKLQWITISSEQAILMSICLQSMVNELLLKKSGVRRKTVTSGKQNNWNYIKRDGSSQVISVSQSSSGSELSSSIQNVRIFICTCQTFFFSCQNLRFKTVEK